MTPDDKRIDLDATDLDDLQLSLQDDIQEATKSAKKQIAKDVAREKDAEQEQKDKILKLVLIAIGALLVFILAYWMTFGRESEPVMNTNTGPIAPAPQSHVSPPPIPSYTTPPQPVNRPPANMGQPRAAQPGSSISDYDSPDM